MTQPMVKIIWSCHKILCHATRWTHKTLWRLHHHIGPLWPPFFTLLNYYYPLKLILTLAGGHTRPHGPHHTKYDKHGHAIGRREAEHTKEKWAKWQWHHLVTYFSCLGSLSWENGAVRPQQLLILIHTAHCHEWRVKVVLPRWYEDCAVTINTLFLIKLN